MNTFIYLLILPFMVGAVTPGPNDDIDSSEDRIKVEKAVVAWADSTFYMHVNYKFENFRAEYSESYFIAVMRAKAYKERLTELEKQKQTGRYKGSQEDYEKEHKELKATYEKIQNEADTHPMRADYYLIHFWTNIQTTDGITVYYEHILKLNNAYQVIEAKINSAIGKKDENTMPLYKKDVKSTGGDPKKKVDNTTTEEVKIIEEKIENPVTEENPKKEDNVTSKTTDSKKKSKKKKDKFKEKY